MHSDPGVVLRNPPGRAVRCIGANEKKIISVRGLGGAYTWVGQGGGEMKVKLCMTCGIYRPPETHHCRLCDQCVHIHDHHCDWLGLCIGVKNRRDFIVGLMWVVLWLIWLIVVGAGGAMREATRGGQEKESGGTENNGKKGQGLLTSILILPALVLFLLATVTTTILVPFLAALRERKSNQKQLSTRMEGMEGLRGARTLQSIGLGEVFALVLRGRAMDDAKEGIVFAIASGLQKFFASVIVLCAVIVIGKAIGEGGKSKLLVAVNWILFGLSLPAFIFAVWFTGDTIRVFLNSDTTRGEVKRRRLDFEQAAKSQRVSKGGAAFVKLNTEEDEDEEEGEGRKRSEEEDEGEDEEGGNEGVEKSAHRARVSLYEFARFMINPDRYGFLPREGEKRHVNYERKLADLPEEVPTRSLRGDEAISKEFLNEENEGWVKDVPKKTPKRMQIFEIGDEDKV